MKLYGALILLLAVSFSSCEESNKLAFAGKNEEDPFLTVPELIEKNGYPVEVHHVETADGYILEMHRIPYGLTEGAGPAANKPVVFLQHGIFLSSAAWVISGPQKGLGYLLADLGYDVWMGNVRGTKYSRNHTTLSPNEAKFWNFSWHEIGVYDLPAMIDYTLEQTNQRQTFYIGHGQGTTVFYVMCSEMPEYNSKIRAQFSMAPVAFMGHVSSPLLQMMASYWQSYQQLWGILGLHEVLPSIKLIPYISEKYCNDSPTEQLICTNMLFVTFGYNLEQLNTTLLPVIMDQTPDNASVKQVLHYLQLIKSGKFQKYDYGLAANMIKYKQMKPPSYDLTKVTSPVGLFYSHNDVIVSEVDVMKLASQLPNLIGKFLVKDEKFSHLDYLWGKDAPELVYGQIFYLMMKY